MFRTLANHFIKSVVNDKRGIAPGLVVGGASALASLFGGKDKKSVNAEDYYTPEQRQAQQSLFNYGQTGRIGDFQAGEAYNGSLGNFETTGIENQSLSALAELLNAGNPQALGDAEDVFRGFANTEFNPDDPSSGFASFARQVARATGDANDVINREANITGNRFNSRILQEKGDLQSRQSDALSQQLANLFNASQDRKLQGAQGLTGVAQLSEGINQGRIASGINYGGLERDLQNQQTQVKYNDFLRQRNERLGSIASLNSVLSSNLPTGQITTESPSALSQLGNLGLGAIAKSAGNSDIFDNLFKFGGSLKPTKTVSLRG